MIKKCKILHKRYKIKLTANQIQKEKSYYKNKKKNKDKKSSLFNNTLLKFQKEFSWILI